MKQPVLDEHLRLLTNFDFESRCVFIAYRSKAKWKARLNREIPCELPRDNSNTPDIKYLPSNFTHLMNLFTLKCKYCPRCRVNPEHLNRTHKFQIEPFSLEKVFNDWKALRNRLKKCKRQEIIDKGHGFIQKFINCFKSHVCA